MSQENVEVVRAAFAATRRRDRQAFRSLYHPDIQWDDPSGLWGDWGTRRGVDDIEDAFRTWFEAWEQPAIDLERIVDAGDQVVAFVRASGRGRESGLVIDQVIPQAWTVDGGRVVRVRGYRTEARSPRSRRACRVGDVAENVEIVRAATTLAPPPMTQEV